ncbi:MAG: hypothetical protein A2653_03265 [Candidatus Zambryskibacteria bacterium RIFCSPHIGHO2_01_FULL_43_25]|nr:MAG: hypothetical protein A2653_03265 [Candidatus Zambryskibacteria bacterium RIFCSPHIGHO2_01_FULL_43_25]OHB00616.1 MAG: hypothetical protein A3E94_03185 [Candidatus Zambryskibacteria bacterium RIFCSPHIGHO2_12_FULL_44_12b]
MDPEERRKLERTLSLAEDNNRMIKKLYRAMRWSRLMHFVYIAIIIAASVGLYYYIQPYLERVIEVYGNVRGALENASDLIPGR